MENIVENSAWDLVQLLGGRNISKGHFVFWLLQDAVKENILCTVMLCVKGIVPGLAFGQFRANYTLGTDCRLLLFFICLCTAQYNVLWLSQTNVRYERRRFFFSPCSLHMYKRHEKVLICFNRILASLNDCLCKVFCSSLQQLLSRSLHAFRFAFPSRCLIFLPLVC